MKGQIERLSALDLSGAGLIVPAGMGELLAPQGRYFMECREYEGGPIVWRDEIKNLFTTAGKNFIWDNILAGSAYTATWYMGLISATSYTTGPAAGDTMASHGGWAEDQNYSQAARPTTAWSAASGGAKSLSAALAFTANATTTLKGAFITSVATKGGITGTLLSAGLFTGGDQPVVSGNSLSVSYTASL